MIRAVDGPLANVRGVRSDELEYDGSARRSSEVWIAVRASLRGVLEQVTLADVARGRRCPTTFDSSLADPDAWAPH